MKTLVEVVWLDAADGSIKHVDEEGKRVKPEDGLVERSSYGLLYSQNENGVIVATTDDARSVEYIAIPKGMIKKIKRAYLK